MDTTPIAFILAAALALALTGGIAGAEDGAPPAPPAAPAAPAAELEAVEPGDLSALEPAVREQLAEVHESLAAPRQALAEVYGRMGMHYHAYNLLEPASAAYRNASVLAPGDPRWVYYLGEVARRAGDLEAAAAHFEAVLTAEPDDLAVLVALGRIELDRDRLDRADELLEQARALAPDDAAVLAGLGEVALARGEAGEAAELLEAALERVPAATRLHHPLGLAYRQLGDLERAREHLAARGEVGLRVADPRRAALEELATGERIYILRGRAAFAAGDYAAAVEAFRQAAEAAPASAGARVNLGAALGVAGDRDGAVAAFRAALELEPDNATAHYNLGQLLADTDPESATGHLERAVELVPRDGEVRRHLAAALRRAGRREEALRQYELTLAAAPEDEEAHIGLAALRVDLGRYADALDGLEAAHGVLPHAGRVAAALARMLAAVPDASLRDGERALALADHVLAAAPTPEHAELLALAMAELGRCDEAARWQRQALVALAQAPEARRQAVERNLAFYAAGPPCRPPIDG